MRFVQGLDYGPRRGTLGFVVHMAEGGDGTLGYLAQRSTETREQWRIRVRGVSANFVILSTGETVQMVAWDNASGSMDPDHRGPTSGFYSTIVVQSVLGSHYVNPNAYSLSVELAGYRDYGPTRPQIEALVDLIRVSRIRYPLMRGAYGHADQTATKGCPGLSGGMREVWTRVGHGLFPLPQEDIVKVFSSPGITSGLWAAGSQIFPGPTGASSGSLAVARRFLIVGQDLPTASRFLVDGGWDNASSGMAWLDAAWMTNQRDESFNAGVTAAAQRADGAKRAQ